MNVKRWRGLSETTKRNLCMVPAAMILGAIWLSETLNPPKPRPDWEFSLQSARGTNFVAQAR